MNVNTTDQFQRDDYKTCRQNRFYSYTITSMQELHQTEKGNFQESLYC